MVKGSGESTRRWEGEKKENWALDTPSLEVSTAWEGHQIRKEIGKKKVIHLTPF